MIESQADELIRVLQSFHEPATERLQDLRCSLDALRGCFGSLDVRGESRLLVRAVEHLGEIEKALWQIAWVLQCQTPNYIDPEFKK